MVFHDKEFGKIATRRNARAKNIIARYDRDHILITLPYGFDVKHLLDVINEMRPQLQNLIKRAKSTISEVSSGMVINTASVPIKIEVSDSTPSFSYQIKKDEAIIFIAPHINIEAQDTQKHLLYMINNIIYMEAQRVLIPLTWKFAKQFNMDVSDVKISKSRGRWGSCSSRKSINLSYYLMVLPQKLIDYVILHELAHTIELNHSKAFWDILDKMCGEDSKALSNIARKYKSDVLDLVRSY